MAIVQILFLLILGLAYPARAVPRAPQLTLGFVFEGRVVEERFHHGQKGGLEIGARFDHELSDTFSVGVEAAGHLQTGAFESAFLDEYGTQSSLDLREAILAWRPTPFLQLNWGVLPHSSLPTLIHNKSFLGLSESIHANVGQFRFFLEGEQSLATSPSRTLFPTFGGREIPFFMLEQVGCEYGWETFQASVHLSHFSFLNLTREVEYRSRHFGNSGVGANRENASLRYVFHGVEAGVDLEVRWGRFRPNVRVNAHRNFDPPQDRGDAVLVETGLEFQWSPAVVTGVTFLGFEIEADAGPAFYSNKYFGHNNRRGYGASLALEFPQDAIKVQVGYVSADPIDPNGFQARFQQGFVLFEASYDLL